MRVQRTVPGAILGFIGTIAIAILFLIAINGQSENFWVDRVPVTLLFLMAEGWWQGYINRRFALTETTAKLSVHLREAMRNYEAEPTADHARAIRESLDKENH